MRQMFFKCQTRFSKLIIDLFDFRTELIEGVCDPIKTELKRTYMYGYSNKGDINNSLREMFINYPQAQWLGILLFRAYICTTATQ